MISCFFSSDLHGSVSRYQKLFLLMEKRRPSAVFLGGDILPGAVRSLAGGPEDGDFLQGFLAAGFRRLRKSMGSEYPEVFLILGNDDGREPEHEMEQLDRDGLWHYVHGRSIGFSNYTVIGYSFVPPTPFRLKDWEKYDVSRFVDPGCAHPGEGIRTIPVSDYEIEYSTIKEELKTLTEGVDMSRTIMLFHSPPYDTLLDRADLDGVKVDHAPLDVHVGSIAIQRFIKKNQPLLTLHGHVHESARLTGKWMQTMGGTVMLNAAHDGPELSLITFDPADAGSAFRELL